MPDPSELNSNTAQQQTEKKELVINKLVPPVEVQQQIMARDGGRLSHNAVIRFVQIFILGDGF